MALLTAIDILNCKDIEKEIVPVPEWGGEVIVRGLTGAQRDEFESTLDTDNRTKTISTDNIRAKLVAFSLVDEEENLIFKASDIESLGKKSASALDRVFAVAQRLSGFSKKDLEELEKN